MELAKRGQGKERLCFAKGSDRITTLTVRENSFQSKQNFFLERVYPSQPIAELENTWD
jgi:hypothetical protein